MATFSIGLEIGSIVGANRCVYPISLCTYPILPNVLKTSVGAAPKVAIVHGFQKKVLFSICEILFKYFRIINQLNFFGYSLRE